jgi:Cell division protein
MVIASRARPGADASAASPIVPPQAIAGRTLVLVIAIMTFLAGFTIAVVSVIDRAADAWATDIGREVTIEIRPFDGVAVDAEVEKAVALAQEFPGVGGARGISDAETQRLLEPWLGPGVDLSALPVPRLVIVSIDDARVFDAKALADSVGAR